MSLATQSARVEYTASASQTTFAYPFRIFEATDLAVYKNASLLTSGLYAVTGVGDDAGGNVVLVTGATAGDELIIESQIPTSQLVTYTPGGAFPATSHERGLDRLARQIQQHRHTLSRCLQLNTARSFGLTGLELPHPDTLTLAAGGSKALRWNTGETNLELFEVAPADDAVGLLASSLTLSALAGLPAAGTSGRARLLTDTDRALYVDDGSRWRSLTYEVREASAFGLSTAATAATNRAALQAAYDSLPAAGGIIRMLHGTYTVNADTNGKVVELATGKPCIWQGAGMRRTVLQMAAGSGDFVAFFAPEATTDDMSGLCMYDLTLDVNGANNLIDLESELTGTNGSFIERRNGVYFQHGFDVHLARCRFLDFPRQGIYCDAREPGDAGRITVEHCVFETTLEDTPTDEWDTTACFVRGDDLVVAYNTFLGKGTNYHRSRTALQASGSRVAVIGNTFDKYYRGPLVGNGGNWDAVADGVAVVGNTITNCNRGITLLSFATASVTSGPGLRNCLIAANSIHTDAVTYHRVDADLDVPVGILLDSTSDLPLRHVRIVDNIIDNETYTGGGLSGIHINLVSTTGLLTVDLTISRNTIDNPAEAGVGVVTGDTQGVSITENICRNVGRKTGATAGQLAGVRVTSLHTALRLNRNHIIDVRGTTLTTAGVHLTLSSGSAGVEALDNAIYLADSRDIPVVESTTLNGAPHIRARTGSMDFVAPFRAAYGSIIIDEANGVTYTMPVAPDAGSASWIREKQQATFTVGTTGFSGTDPSGTARYELNGDAVTLFLPELTGTSDANTFTLTGIPTHLQAARDQFALVRATDNGAIVLGSLLIDAATGTWSLRNGVGGAPTSWTASGTKTLHEQTITYTLA
jgi:Right handed beta helix region